MDAAVEWFHGLVLFFGAFGLGWRLTPAVGRWAARRGKVAVPREDRWHRIPTPLLGGVAIAATFYAATGVGLLLGWFGNMSTAALHLAPLLVCGAAMFLLGLWDDFRNLSPQTKLVAQIVLASVLVFFGYKIDWFVSKTANTFLSILWIVGMTNAFNLLDNMDGLSAGVAAIAGFFLLAFEVLHGGGMSLDPHIGLLPIFLGAVLGFLCHNRHPASIFMGDCGSLFLGFLLAGISTQNELSRHGHLVPIVMAPLFVFSLPVADMALVSVMRTMFCRSVACGGRDHTSHRLVAIGLDEKRAVRVLYGFSVLGGAVALLSAVDMGLFYASAALFVLLTVVFLVRLAQVRVYPPGEKSLLEKKPALTVLWVQFTYKKRVFEVMLDVFLIAFCYWLAYYLRYERWSDPEAFPLFLGSLPVILICCLASYVACGIYRGVWRYTTLSDLSIHVLAVSAGVCVSLTVLVFAYDFKGFSRTVFAIFWLLSLLSLSGSRLSFRLLSEFLNRLVKKKGRPTLIYGANRNGAYVLQELLENADLGLVPVGFIDADERTVCRRMFGYKVLGTLRHVPKLVRRYGVQEIVVASRDISQEIAETLETTCREMGVVLRRAEFRLSPCTEADPCEQEAVQAVQKDASIDEAVPHLAQKSTDFPHVQKPSETDL
ncbi:hypothetical protein [Desulfosoma caldarium]|uniref:UDP-GlcNAc:undecaprenyl-phosphate GlcNAc-1-phosphate transferase n=1 Tax=Desulfosoma caldarium TaxID=610254 RepID=A0A3N1VJY5_9BACT|nr:hypothetical protein [Desulfosoma caldarium]ROR03125.1 UDP-GlcNAc:undecaprenyl-phosphate GlcNAc-1-phosphate transferase [Desulfosoma caldarium]